MHMNEDDTGTKTLCVVPVFLGKRPAKHALNTRYEPVKPEWDHSGNHIRELEIDAAMHNGEACCCCPIHIVIWKCPAACKIP